MNAAIDPIESAIPGRITTPGATPTSQSPAMSRLLSLSTWRRRYLSRLLNQQFWLFGYDVRRPDGNILLDFGFEKCRPPAGGSFTSSRYVRIMNDGLAIGLWGFGMYISEGGERGLFLTRSGLAMRVHTCADVLSANWNPLDCDELRAPRNGADAILARSLLGRGACWVSSYEREVVDRYGLAYRQQALAAWKRVCCPAEDVGTEWSNVATVLQLPVPFS
jgi:hypothetical protein